MNNHFVIHYNNKYHRFIAPECYLNKLKLDCNGKKSMDDMINPNLRDKVQINTKGFIERTNDIYLTDPTWYENLSDIPFYVLNLAL